MNINDLIDAEKRLEGFAARYRRGTGMVTLRECWLCGHLSFVSFSPGESNGVRLDTMNLNDVQCTLCYQVSTRSPEVYDWVRSVAASILAEVKRLHSPTKDKQ
jgi:hypothetical protein